MSEQTKDRAHDVSALSEALKDTHRHIEELERIQAGGGRGVIMSDARGRAGMLTERIIALSQSRMDFPAPGVAPEWSADCMSPAHVIRILLSEAHDRWGDCLEVPRSDLVAWLSSRITQWSAPAQGGES
jgi:hypothetical protein